ncbi:hypothetical protein K438DRAFT_1834979 [Mycena galopus ATCC 62051]|nr:hypothetical protein K438DRAFT_1834979 [Mycena galopus ATCC 62051]
MASINQLQHCYPSRHPPHSPTQRCTSHSRAGPHLAASSCLPMTRCPHRASVRPCSSLADSDRWARRFASPPIGPTANPQYAPRVMLCPCEKQAPSISLAQLYTRVANGKARRVALARTASRKGGEGTRLV